MDMLLLITIHKEECQTPKWWHYHKISHAHYSWSQQSAEDGTLHKHQWLDHVFRHFCTMWADDKLTLRKDPL